MSIQVSEVIRTVLGLNIDPNQKLFNTPYLILAFNAAAEHAFTELHNISEWQWLQKGTITIDSAAVTAKTRSYALPDRTMYVSNWARDRDARITDRDFRPVFNNGLDDTYLLELVDYSVSLPNFVLHYDPEETGTITFWYKALPARITNEDQTFTGFPDFFFNYFVEYMTWYCMRRNEDVDPRQDPIIAREIFKLRGILNNAGGKPDGFVPNWDNVCDYDL